MTNGIPRCAIEYDSVPPRLWLAERRRRAEELSPGRGHRHFALGRSALLWLCRTMGWGPGDRFLMPAYTCESVSDPFLEAGIELDFYGVNPDLSVDLDDLRRRLPGARGGVLIHYFGWPQPLPVRQWLATRGPDAGFWIEDLTHSLYTQPLDGPYGTAGDAVLVSYRKLFPTADGCVLSFRDRLPAADAAYEAGLRYGIHAAVRYARLALTGLLGGGRRPRGYLLRRFDASLRSLRIQPPIRTAPMSFLSRHLVERFDIEDAMERRRANALELMAALSSLAGVRTIFPGLDPGVVPGLLPIRVLEGQRDRVREYLDERGIEAHFHWRRPPGLEAEQHPATDRLREEQLSLPLDERYGLQDMRNIALMVRAAVARDAEVTREGGLRHAVSG